MSETTRHAARRRQRALAATAIAAGAATAVGFAFGHGREGDVATGFGVLAGAGAVIALAALVMLWLGRGGRDPWTGAPEAGETALSRRDRLQAVRSRMLFAVPLLGLLFFALSLRAVPAIVAGDADFSDLLAVALPVIYAWLAAAVAMGWDHNGRRNRRFLEDELTVVLRARAMTAAFWVLMTGATAALGLALFRPEAGAVAMLAAVTLAGGTAGARFAWLDREAGRDA